MTGIANKTVDTSPPGGGKKKKEEENETGERVILLSPPPSSTSPASGGDGVSFSPSSSLSSASSTSTNTSTLSPGGEERDRGHDNKINRSESPSQLSNSSNLSSSSEGEEDIENDEDTQSDSGIRRRTRTSLSPPRRRGFSPLNPTNSTTSASASSTTSPSPTDLLTKIIINFLCISVSLLISIFFLFGSYDYFKNFEENKCEMTYMFRYPFYHRLPVGSGLDELYPMYHLYAYAEGEEALKEMSSETHRFTGIPILYIPGNAGSHQQVRSLASVSLWKYLDGNTPFHFDYFTVSLNEEFSGLYGYSLKRQVEFVREAILKITSLYEDYHKPILVGHSMGGVIAKAVAVDWSPLEDKILSNFIITLATPHSSPIAIFDPEQDLFYHALNKNWTKSEISEEITVISIAGGDRDLLVPPKFTKWEGNSLQVKATGIPSVWASTDHLCIVWCKQLVLSTVRALFDLVQLQERNKYFAISDNFQLRKDVLNYHFVNRSGVKSFHGSGAPRNAISLPKNIEQVESSSGIFCQAAASPKPQYVLFPMEFLMKNVTKSNIEEDDARVVILTTNSKEKHWILGCTSSGIDGSRCSSAESLAHKARIIPHLRRRRKMVDLSLSNLISSSFSHLIVRLDPHPFKTCVMLETYSKSEREVDLGGEFISNQKIFYSLNLSPRGFLSYLVAWKVSATIADNKSCPESHNLLAQFDSSPFWSEVKFLKNESVLVRLQDWSASRAEVKLWLEPSCNYKVKTSIAPLETSGQFFRLVWRMIPAFYGAVLLMAMFFQKDPANWFSFHLLLLSNAYHLTLLPGFIFAVLLQFIPTDWPLMLHPNEYSPILPILLFSIAYILVLSISTLTWYLIITGGTTIHSVIVQLVSSRFSSWLPSRFTSSSSFRGVQEHLTEAAVEVTLTRFPLSIALILLALSFATCGALGISLVAALYLVKLFKIYEDLLEDLLKAKIANLKDNLSPINFHFSCFMLWLLVTLLNIPSLLHWTRDLGSGAKGEDTQWDLSMYLALLLLPTVAILWQEFVPKMEPTIWNLHRYAFYAMGLACALWGTHRLYITAFLITFVFLTMAICQLVSVMINALINNSNTAAATSENAPPREEETPPQAPPQRS
ncbi:unnamed protein product [Orchesella dallaii]|uniref:GPI inositol-deacylase n=1 Tax=Orchesella dallaii TaxID=48710 RepID=A0ABP1S0V0_9HEXA